MPQRRTSIKALRQSQQRRLHNLDIKTALKKTIKKFVVVAKGGNSAEAKEALKVVYKKLDKAAKTHLISENTAGRNKSRLSRLLAQKVS